MRIDPTGSLPSPIRPATGTTTRAADKAADGTTAAAEAETFTPTTELTRLLAAVAQQPDVRADVIESIAARLAAGDFDTPEAAADAARNLLQSGE